MKNVFIVGCPRSGTTLLQSLLASHPEVVSFPETHLWSETMHIHPLMRLFKVYGKGDLHKLDELCGKLGHRAPEKAVESLPVFRTATWSAILLEALQGIAENHATGTEHVLLEKTPRHLHFTDQICMADPEARFIHIIRRGEDVVASMMEATGNHPGQWDGSRDVSKSVFWWNRAIGISNKYMGRPGHIHISYEELLDQTSEVVQVLCRCMDVPFVPEMLENYKDTADSVIQDEESWKAKNTRSISSSDKFTRLPESIQKEIRNGLTDFDYGKIRVLQ